MFTPRSVFIAFLVAGTTNAFAPVKTTQSNSIAPSSTSLQFGFLKELGLEKPSWLPDFGGKKEEEEAPAPAEEAEESSDEETSDEE